MALEILAHAARGGAPATNLPARIPRWLDRVRERLHDQGCLRPSLTELAQLAGVHSTHLARTFHRLCHCTIGEYLRRLRLARARELLAAGDRPLAQVARECGFYDQSHFTRVFGRYVGVTPGRFQPPPPPVETGRTDRA